MPAQEKPNAVVIDLDGTVADCHHREHHLAGDTPDWEAFFAGSHLDLPLTEGVAMANEHAQDCLVVWLTGRPERFRQMTVDWLAANGLPTANLNMRPDDDMRPAAVFKTERLAQLGETYDISLIIDDDDLVVAALREAGWQVHHAQWMTR
jgi:hypothetical protein